MKNVLYLILLLICSGIFYSCQTEERFSCNEQVDNWVKKHLNEIQQSSLEEWRGLPQSVSIAAYRALSNNKRYLFWKQKMNELLALDWDKEKREAIEKLSNVISQNPNWFNGEYTLSTMERDKFELTMYEWIDYAETIGLNDKQIFGVLGTLQQIDQEGDVVQMPITRWKIMSDEDIPLALLEGPCNCNQNNDFCSHSQDCYLTDKCDSANHGCGWIFVQECNGVCIP